MITVSIVSHGHGVLLPELINQLLEFSEVGQVIVTLNIPELVDVPADPRITVLQNKKPQGFGANHNQAFALCQSTYFCVLNPDITFHQNPFSTLISVFSNTNVGLVAPLVKNHRGGIEDSMRKFPTPFSILCRQFLKHSDTYRFQNGDPHFDVEWLAGMCMLFQSSAYRAVDGFDEQYFMYVEDADICTRLWQSGYKVVGCPSAVVIHAAQRASHRNFQHFRWHLASLLRYFNKYTGRLPQVP
jgi:GT2 family glycosyltransferase